MTSIAVDSLDNAHISYVDGNGHVMYATDRSGSWSKTAVAVGETPSIAVGTSDKVHISYVDSDRILYATSFGDSWVSMTAADWPPLGCGAGGDRSIAVTLDGSVRIGHLGFDGTALITSSSPCVDNDNDGCGDPASPECPCPARDCNDADPDVSPGITEGPFGDPTCSDTVDNDCDGDVDAKDSSCCECIDNDSDGYGNPACENCTYPDWDCDDAEPGVNPGATEIPGNGVNDDCDPATPAYPEPANTIAASYGRSSLIGSGVCNQIALLFIPAGAIFFLKILRRRK